ncbi:hypothetical protein [Corynebacterium sp. TAE3-ERU2]|uniref:hypothetical protein n=1 Tax=Corynebacterium sp. TAE3-ERU2 TaxID=2849497 RepID=UPI001C46AB54|nr:hypothetical protein [Corynebacterium sp. TAE3-ERU2]MBV7301277.1 hypothetical protein [Corynebacterium sp. TAE3-ERU2]
MTPPCRSHRPRRLSRSVIALCAVGAVGLAGCSAEDSATDTAAVDSDNAVELQLDSPKVTVIDAGAQDSATELRYTATADSPEEELSVVAYDGFSQQIAALNEVEPQAPAGGDVTSLTLPLTGHIDGDSGRVELALGAPTSTDLSLNDTLASAEGFRIAVDRSDRGIANSVRLAAPKEASDEARSMVESAVFTWLSLSVVFPEEPLGDGAQWTVDSRVPGENSMLQTITYTLDAHEGTTATLSAEIQRRSTLGALSAGEDHPELEVVSTESTSTGELTVNLDSSVRNTGRMAVTTRLVYAADAAREDQQAVIQDLTSAVEYSSP